MAGGLVGLAVLISLLEGINIGLLIPLLESLESSGSGDGHWISQIITNVFSAIGIPLKLGTILAAIAVAVFTVSILKYLRMLLVGKVMTGFGAWIRTRYMWNLLEADLSYFHGSRLGVLSDNLTTQSSRAGGSAAHVAEFVANVCMIIVYLVTAFLVSPALTGMALAVMFLVSLSMQPHVTMAKAKAAEGVRRDNALQATAVETLGGVQVIKSFLLERLRWGDFSNKADGVADIGYQLIRNRSQMTVLQELALFGLIGAIVYLGVVSLDLSIAVIVALLFVLYRLMPRVSNLNTMRQDLAESLAALHAVKQGMDRVSSPTVTSGTTPFTRLDRAIEFEGVTFSYDDNAEVLQDVSFKVEKGKMTALVGASGAGKSTLMDLLLRFYDPVSGRIMVDATDLREMDLATWRRAIGVVSQDIYLFNDTVANNISGGRAGVTMEDVSEAAKRAYAHEFITMLPQGYETSIGDRGWNLSGGERQRIALARAIVMRPELLVLDEATSSLDSESEQLIQQYVRSIKGSCTVVAVAHRMATIRDADHIVVIQDGKVAEMGDRDKLLEEAGIFASYQQLQSSG